MERLELISVDGRCERDFPPRERRNRARLGIVKRNDVLGLLPVRVRHGLVAQLRQRPTRLQFELGIFRQRDPNGIAETVRQRAPMPIADFMRPSSPSPASVTPRCSG